MPLLCICPALIGGLSLLNEDGNFKVFFPRNSFVTITTLTHTNTPRKEHSATVLGNDHIACYGGRTQAAQVKWHNSNGGQLAVCITNASPAPCRDCGALCQGNGAVGVDRPLNGHTDIHMYTNSPSYVNQDLECRVSNGPSAFIGVYLKNGGEFVVSHYSTNHPALWTLFQSHYRWYNYILLLSCCYVSNSPSNVNIRMGSIYTL